MTLVHLNTAARDVDDRAVRSGRRDDGAMGAGDVLTQFALRATKLAGELDARLDAAPAAGARLESATARGPSRAS